MKMMSIKTRNSGFCRLKQKKGMFDTIVTIFAILFLLFVFIAFAFLFDQSVKQRREEPGGSEFSSVNTEFLLKTFLKSPPYDLGNNPVKNPNAYVGDRPINADLVSWTCSNNKDQNYKALKASINNFYDGVYDDDWELWILYSNPNIDKKSFGHTSFLDDIKKSINRLYTAVVAAGMGSVAGGTSGSVAMLSTFSVPYRQNGFASQLIPCQDGTLSSVMLYSHIAYFEIKLLK